MRANNGAPMTPTLIVTRPLAQSVRFAAEVEASCKQPVRVLISPLLKIEMLPVATPVAEVCVFTSANGVEAAKALNLPKGIIAWCVGEKTAALAHDAGFVPQIGPGDADGLVADMISAHQTGKIAHIRGTHTRGNVAARLIAAGLDCIDVVAYDQTAVALSTEALAALHDANPVILPLFSPRTSTILNKQGPFTAPIWAVAMSEAVKNAVDPGADWNVSVAARPDAEAMLAGTLRVLSHVAS